MKKTKKSIAFICSRFNPYEGHKGKPGSSTLDNINAAGRIARLAHRAGYTPIVPHLNFLYLDAEKPAEAAIAVKACLNLIPMVDVLILETQHGITKHMKNEVRTARDNKIRIIMADVLTTKYGSTKA